MDGKPTQLDDLILELHSYLTGDRSGIGDAVLRDNLLYHWIFLILCLTLLKVSPLSRINIQNEFPVFVEEVAIHPDFAAGAEVADHIPVQG